MYACVPHKNGWTSFKTAAAESLGITRAQFKDMGLSARQVKRMSGERLLAVRDPVDRFRSLWKHVNREAMADRRHGFIWEHRLHGSTPDELMAFVESHPDENRHWVRQSSYLVEDVILVRFDRILAQLGLPEKHLNGIDAECPPMPVDRILSHYSVDKALADRSA